MYLFHLRVICFGIGTGLLMTMATPAWAADLGKTSLLPIVVKAGKVIGEIRHLHDVHNGPLVERGAVNLSEYYREIGARIIRIHDTPWTFDPAVDMHFVFPNFKSDPDDPANYDFVKTDETIAAIEEIGAETIYRLGESAELNNRRYNNPPADFAKWADIAVNIVRHYNNGWANGFHYGIKYWEVWNEPDIPNFWTGTKELYFELYEKTARAIKAHDPDLLVGGPALASKRDFLEDFLAHCRDNDVPLDFVSFHSYSTMPALVAQYTREIRDIVDKHGFPKAQTMLTEWSYFPGDWTRLHVEPEYTKSIFEQIHGPAGAAYAASLLIYLQDTPLDIANYYTGTTMWYGMFDCFGVPLKVFYPFRAFAQMFDTPNRLATKGSDDDAFAVLAGRAKDKSAVSVLISNLRRQNDGYRIQFDKLPWKGDTVCEVRVIGAGHDLELVRETTFSGKVLELDGTTTPPVVHLIKLRRGK